MQADPARLRELAERVMRATGPDRELDAEVARATGYIPANAISLHWSDDRRGLRGLVPDIRGWEDDWWVVRTYTASLDAAASLVPEGWHVVVEHGAWGGWKVTAYNARALLLSSGKVSRETEPRAKAATEPLARLAAALLAMAHDAEAGR